jgi:hypothetical protein
VAVRKDHSPAGIGKKQTMQTRNPLAVRGKIKLAIGLGLKSESAGDSGAEARGCDPQPFRPHPNFTPIPMPASPAIESLRLTEPRSTFGLVRVYSWLRILLRGLQSDVNSWRMARRFKQKHEIKLN